jgi:RNA polymerase sigma-70 factor (ECF subfamily)
MPSHQEFIPTRRSLLTRLKQWDDQESWRDFFDTYWKLIYGVARKSGLEDTEAQDVVQETVASVARRMPEFKYDPAIGSFKSWLLRLTRRRIADQYRRRPKECLLPSPPSDQTARTAMVETIPDPKGLELEVVWDDEWRRNRLDAALTCVKRRVAPRQYQIYEAHVIKEWPLGEVARTLGVSARQVYLAKSRVGALVKKELKRLESQML